MLSLINLQVNMRFKHAFDEEGYQELSFEHPKEQAFNCQKIIRNSYGAFQKTNISGKFKF